MPTIDEVLVKVNEEKTVVDGLAAFVAGLRQQLADAMAQVGQVTPEMQAKIDQVFDGVNANIAKLGEVVVAGTEAA